MKSKTGKDLFSQSEPFIFILAVSANLFPFFIRKYFPFTDAPSHLYNSDLLRQLIIERNDFVSQYLQVNDTLVPNWISELLMFPLLAFLEPDVVEKIYLVIYFAGLPFATRYCLSCIAPRQKYLAFLAIPLAYNSLSMISFYNFSSGLIFLMLIIGFFFKHFAKGTPIARHYFVLLILLVFAYFSHLVVFIIALLYMAMIYAEAQYSKYSFQLKKWFGKELLFIGLTLLPALILLIIYYFRKHSGQATFEYLDGKTLLNYFLDAQAWIAFGMAEKPTAGILGWTILTSLILCLYLQFGLRVSLQNRFFPWAGLVVLLLLYYFLPNSDGVGGFVSIRISLLFFLMSVLFIASIELRRAYVVLIILISLVTHWFRLREYGHTIQVRNQEVSYIRDQAALIEPNSFVYWYRCNDDWLSGHFDSYICLGKPGVIALQNYEAQMGYFPIEWKNPEKIRTLVDRLEYFKDLDKVKYELNNRPIYMWVYGDLPSQTQQVYINLNRLLNENCVFVSSNPYASLYRLK